MPLGVQCLLGSIVCVLLLFSGALALAETGLVRTSRVKAKMLSDSGIRGSGSLVGLVAQPEKFLNPVLLLVLMCQLISATLLGILADQWFGAWGVFIATLFEVVVIFVLFEAVPKNWAVHNPERAALLTAGPVSVLVRFWPVRMATSALIGLANFILGRRDAGETHLSVTEAELLAMADVARDEATIDQSEREFIHAVIAFGDTVARSIMTPRPKMTALKSDICVEAALATLLDLGYSRVPVYHNSIDDIAGIAYAKDLIRLSGSQRQADTLVRHLRPALFIPESFSVAKLLRQMQSLAVHQVIVLDEYGITAGVVTLEDVLEELVGEIADEYDNPDAR